MPAGKTTEVLVRLALDAGRPVRADRLIEDLWADAGDRPQHAAVQGVPAAPGARRPGAGRERATAATPSTSTRPASTRSRAADLAARRPRRPDGTGDAATAAGGGGRGAGAVPRRGRSSTPATATGLQAHRARLEEIRLGLLEDQLRRPGRPRRGRRRGRRAGGAGRAAPAAGGPVGLADHRALPGRTAGRRAGRLRAGASGCWSTSSVSSRARTCRRSSGRSCSRARRCTRTRPARGSARTCEHARQPAVAVLAARRPRRRPRRPRAARPGTTAW